MTAVVVAMGLVSFVVLFADRLPPVAARRRARQSAVLDQSLARDKALFEVTHPRGMFFDSWRGKLGVSHPNLANSEFAILPDLSNCQHTFNRALKCEGK